MGNVRPVEDIKKDIVEVEGDIELLRTKGEKPETLTAEEVNQLTEKVDTLERLKNEQKLSVAEQRYAAIRVKDEQPAKPLPVYKRKGEVIARVGEGLSRWLAYHTEEGDNSAESYHKAKELGFDPSKKTICVEIDPTLMNFVKRHIARTVTTVASSHGLEWDYTNYSANIFEHLTYGQPILGFLNVESVPNGRDRVYWSVDDTSLEATDNAASGGTEATPTIPDVDITSGMRTIAFKTINSGYQKVSFEMLQDNPVNFESRAVTASGRSLGRKLDKDLLTLTGDGDPDIEGLIHLCEANALADGDEWSVELIEELTDAIPDYYREGSILVSNSATKAAARRALKDGIGRTYLDKTMVGSQQFDSFLGYAWVVDKNVPDDEILFLNPSHYTVAIVNGQYFKRFDEKFATHTAWLGMMRYAAARTGSDDAFVSVKVSTSS